MQLDGMGTVEGVTATWAVMRLTGAIDSTVDAADAVG